MKAIHICGYMNDNYYRGLFKLKFVKPDVSP